MSDPVKVALITSGFNVLAIVLARIMSHMEHKRTGATVQEIREQVNGKLERILADRGSKPNDDATSTD